MILCTKCSNRMKRNTTTGFCGGCYNHSEHLKQRYKEGLNCFKNGHPMKGRVGPNKGKIFSKEWREKISSAHKKPENIEKAILNLKDFIGAKGEKHGMWKKNREECISPKRNLYEYYTWRKLLLVRDDYKCKINNAECTHELEAHHILNWINYPELRYDINNGIILCKQHHPRGRKNEKSMAPYLKELIKTT